MYQGRQQSVLDYLDHFLNNVKVIEETGGMLGQEPKLIADCLTSMASEQGITVNSLTAE